ncbi:MAG: hypothetical protein AB1473_01040 [Thermodesulfobacteriota bacterium]
MSEANRIVRENELGNSAWRIDKIADATDAVHSVYRILLVLALMLFRDGLGFLGIS